MLHLSPDQTSPAAAEADRLAALRTYEILDTAPEDAFDRVVQLAHSLFGMPTALVSLVDEKRRWAKARLGPAAIEIPRSWAFCNQAIQQAAPLVVPDAAADARFRESPLVAGAPYIRFYAGAPIRDRQGYALGAVCIISPEPNTGFSDADRDRLASLAGIVANEMELRRELIRARRHVLEKDDLIRDMHHQVANSLQIITDVLDLQASAARDAAVKTALHGAAARIISIGEVHQQLRRQGTTDLANANGYFGQLTRRLWNGVGLPAGTGSIAVAVPADLELPPELLARMGLVASALVMNAMRAGAVNVSVGLEPQPDAVVLAISYDGDSTDPNGYDGRSADSSFRMIRVLAGESAITIDPDERRRVLVRFRA